METETDYKTATNRYEQLKDDEKGSEAHQEKMLLVHLISDYEKTLWDLPEVDPIEIIKKKNIKDVFEEETEEIKTELIAADFMMGNTYIRDFQTQLDYKVYDIITIIGVVQALFGMVIFITKQPSHISFLYLAGWFAVIAIFLGSFLLPFEVVDYFKPGIFPILFLLGPLLYFYVSSLTVEDFKSKFRHLLHLIPMVAVSIHRSTTSVVPIMSPADNPLFVYNKVYYFLFVLSLFFYWFLSLMLILKFRKKIPYHFSNYTRNNSLTWLLFVLTFFLLFFMFDFVRRFISIAMDIEFISFSMLPLNLAAFVFIMIFFGINQSVIFRPMNRKSVSDLQDEYMDYIEPKYIRSVIHDDEVKALNETIVTYLKNKKPYLNPDFNLEMMASDLEISRHKLSQVINTEQNKNFHKLINGYRIREVKDMLIDPAYGHFSVLGIAFECGFNSKSAFNRIFKEETGLTPSQYKRTN